MSANHYQFQLTVSFFQVDKFRKDKYKYKYISSIQKCLNEAIGSGALPGKMLDVELLKMS